MCTRGVILLSHNFSTNICVKIYLRIGLLLVFVQRYDVQSNVCTLIKAIWHLINTLWALNTSFCSWYYFWCYLTVIAKCKYGFKFKKIVYATLSSLRRNHLAAYTLYILVVYTSFQKFGSKNAFLADDFIFLFINTKYFVLDFYYIANSFIFFYAPSAFVVAKTIYLNENGRI